jgi:hypothetical protein
MAEVEFKLTGWKAVGAILVVVGIMGVRLATFNDITHDEELMQELKVLLMSDYYPGEAERLKAVMESGNVSEIGEVAKSITTAKLNIESVQASYALFDFSSSKDVIIKVKYKLDDSSGARNQKTLYYRFKHGSVFNNWQYRYESSALSYYLNFI